MSRTCPHRPIRAAPVGDRRIDRIGELQPEQAAAGLDLRPEVGGGESVHGTAQSRRKIERRGRVRLLRGDHAAPGPLADPGGAGEGHCADLAVLVDDRRPHVIAQSAIARLARRHALEGRRQGRVDRALIAQAERGARVARARGARRQRST